MDLLYDIIKYGGGALVGAGIGTYVIGRLIPNKKLALMSVRFGKFLRDTVKSKSEFLFKIIQDPVENVVNICSRNFTIGWTCNKILQKFNTTGEVLGWKYDEESTTCLPYIKGDTVNKKDIYENSNLPMKPYNNN